MEENNQDSSKKRQRQQATTPTQAPAPPPQHPSLPALAELRVQGVGDLVEGSLALQQQQQHHQQPPQQQVQQQQQQQNSSWSLHRLDDWRARSFGAEGERHIVQQQQRDLRRMLLQNSKTLSPTKKGASGGGVRP